MYDKILKNPVSMAAKRLTQRLANAIDEQGKQATRNRELDAERAAKQAKFASASPSHDAMVRGSHQQLVAAASAPSRADAKTASSHIQAALKGPPPGLQLRSVRVAPPDSGSGPKQQGFAWRAPKSR